MLAKRRVIQRNGQEIERTPLLVPSFSSKGFPEIKKTIAYCADLIAFPAGLLRDAMKRQLSDAAVEIGHHEAELEAAQKAARITEHDNSHTSIARFRAAKAKLNSADTEERLAARRNLAQELRLRITKVELRRDRTMLVRFNDGRGGDNLVELSFTAEGLGGIRHVREGQSFPIERATELALVEGVRVRTHMG